MPESSCPQVPPFYAPADPLSASYAVEAVLDAGSGTLTGAETITLTNVSSLTLHTLVLRTGLPNGEAADVTVDGHEPAALVGADGDDGPLVLVALPQPLGPGSTVRLGVSFRAPLPAPRFGSLMLADWHPRLWWGHPTHDQFRVRLDVPPHYVVTASGRADADGRTWRAQGVRTFGVVAGRDLAREEAEAGDTLVRCLFTPAAKRCAELLLTSAVDAVSFYRSELGFYPQPFLSLVPGMDRPAGGFPVATGIVSIHGQERFEERSADHWRWIVAHEIGHQYWGEHVLEADSPGWLWIALGIWMDREYARARGLDPARHWQLLGRYLAGVRDGVDTTIERPPEQLQDLGFDHSNIVTHGKGFAVVSALEGVIGREAFRRALLRCATDFAGKRLGARRFQAACETETGQDLGWFFQQWLRTNRYLSYRVAATDSVRSELGFATTVRVERLGTLDMPVPVEARFEDDTAQQQTTNRLQEATEVVFHSSTPLREAVLDPEGMLAMLSEAVDPTEQDLVREIRNMRWTGAGDQARQLLARAQATTLEAPDAWLKLGLALYDGLYYPEALEAFQRTCESADDDLWRAIGWVWQGHILDLLDRRQEALDWYRRAQAAGFPGSMQHSQYGIELDARWVEDRLQTPFERVEACEDV